MADEGDIKVSVLLDGEAINRYAANALENMVENTNSEITHVVINTGKEEVREDPSNNLALGIEKGMKLIRNHGIWSIIVLRRRIFPPAYAESVHINNITCFDQSERIYTQPQPADGLGNELSSSTIHKIGNSCDVVFRFGFGILKGEVLSAPNYGVLSFHHGDIRKYRGRAGGFWAYINGDQEAGVTLQQLSETLDGGKIAVYESVSIEDACSLREVRYRIHKVSEEMLEKAVCQMENDEFEPSSPDTLGQLYTDRSLVHIARFGAKSIKDRIRCLLIQ